MAEASKALEAGAMKLRTIAKYYGDDSAWDELSFHEQAQRRHAASACLLAFLETIEAEERAACPAIEEHICAKWAEIKRMAGAE